MAHKNITKKELATRLLAMDFKLKTTGDMPSEKAIYAYLSGKVAIRIELIPYIVEILGITEQELFDDSESKRIKQLRHILKNPSDAELNTINALLTNLRNEKNGFPVDYQLKQFATLLPYVPTIAVDKIIKILEKYKSIYQDIEKDI